MTLFGVRVWGVGILTSIGHWNAFPQLVYDASKVDEEGRNVDNKDQHAEYLLCG